MTWINDTKSKARLSAKFAAGLAISAALVLGTFAAPSRAPITRAGAITTTIVEITVKPGTAITIVHLRSSMAVTMAVVMDITLHQ